jgi:hypothetical protein
MTEKDRTWLAHITMAALVVLALWAWLRPSDFGPTPAPQPARSDPYITPRFRAVGDSIEISNADWFPWHEVRLSFRSKLVFGGEGHYYVDVGTINPTGSVTMPLSRFRNPDGLILDPSKVLPRYFVIRARTYQGIATWTREIQ